MDVYKDWIFSTPRCHDPRCHLSEHGEWGHMSIWDGSDELGFSYTGWNDIGTVWIGYQRWVDPSKARWWRRD